MTVAVWYLAWSLATVAVYAAVHRRAWYRYRAHRDRRSKSEFYVSSALFLTALASLFGVGLAILEAGTLLRLGFSALALGAFLGCGIIILLELPREREDR